jgi:hypothetical protein
MKKPVLFILFIGLFTQTSMAQITYSMETWYSLLGFTFPNGWVSSNPLTNNTTVVKDSLVKFTGNYSARIETKVLSSNPLSAYFPDTSGFLVSGSLNIATFKLIQGFPYTTRSNKFGLMAQYTPSGSDQGFVYVALMKRNAQGTGTRDTIGSGWTMINASGSFQPIMVNIDYSSFGYPPSTLPDSAYILISSSKKDTPQPGSKLWVDALEWDPTNLGITDPREVKSLLVFPQPSEGFINVHSEHNTQARLVIHDAQGKVSEMHILKPGNNGIQSHLASGIYFATLLSEDGTVIARSKITISQ